MRYLIPILGLLVLVASLAGLKFKQISMLMAAGAASQKMGPPPETVGTAIAKTETWGGQISAIGSVMAARGVPVANDAPGTVSKISFESGQFVRAGQVLVELDASVERAQLESARARKELAAVSLGRSKKLAQSGQVAQAQLDTDDAGLKGAAADARALEAQIERKTIRAPFSGRLGIRTVNLGQYLTAGTAVTTLSALDSVYVDFTVPQQQLADIKPKTPVKVSLTDDSSPPRGDAKKEDGSRPGAELTEYDGLIAAVDPNVDANTRAIKVRATIPNKGEKLRPGMFVNVAVVLPDAGTLVSVPLTAVIHAPYGDSVFIVEDKERDGHKLKVARQQFVRLGPARGDFVAITDGVKAGDEIVSAGAFKLRNGAAVVINNTDVKQTPSLHPTPQNR